MLGDLAMLSANSAGCGCLEISLCRLLRWWNPHWQHWDFERVQLIRSLVWGDEIHQMLELVVSCNRILPGFLNFRNWFGLTSPISTRWMLAVLVACHEFLHQPSDLTMARHATYFILDNDIDICICIYTLYIIEGHTKSQSYYWVSYSSCSSCCNLSMVKGFDLSSFILPSCSWGWMRLPWVSLKLGFSKGTLVRYKIQPQFPGNMSNLRPIAAYHRGVISNLIGISSVGTNMGKWWLWGWRRLSQIAWLA